MWSGIDFMVSAELINLLGSSKHTITCISLPANTQTHVCVWTGCEADGYLADSFGGRTRS